MKCTRDTYRIKLDASFDLYSAGFMNDAEQVEAFETAYQREAEKFAEQNGVTIKVITAPASSREAQTCDTDEEAGAIWQAIHDAVSWDGPKAS